MATIYRRAPITEAVIEIRTKTVLQVSELERLVARLTKKYPGPAQKTFDMKVDIGEVVSKANQKLSGYRLISNDGSRLLNIGVQSIATVKLAPYEGWERFVEEAKTNGTVRRAFDSAGFETTEVAPPGR